MKKYEVYLTDGRTVIVHAYRVLVNDKSVEFADDYRSIKESIIAEFVLANICGWVEVE